MTIYALSTGTGISGIAIIRVSGPDTKEVIEKLTGLTFLGDSVDDYSDERPCHMTGKMTKRRVILAKTY